MAYNAALGYDPDFDYSAALARGGLTDSERARLTGERKAKISSMYGGIEPTLAGSSQTYSQVYGGAPSGGLSTDYSALLSEAMRSGADSGTVQGLLDKRVSKALGNPDLNKYAYDSVYGDALAYINRAKKAEAADRALEEYRSIYSGENGALARAIEQQQAANNAAVQRTVNSLTQQKEDTNRSYSDYFRQAYIDKMNAQKNIDQRMAAQGVTGGAAESTLLGLNTAYSDALRQAEQERIRALGGLDQAITDAQLTGDITNAQAAADAIREQTNSYADVLRDLINRNDTLSARQYAYDREDAQLAEQYEREDAQAAQAWARQKALQALAYGNMPDDGTLSAAGMTRAEALTLLAVPTGSTSGGRLTITQEPTEEDTIIAAIAALTGEKENNIRALWNSGYDFSAYAAQIPALKKYLNGASPTRSAYEDVVKDIQALRKYGTNNKQVNNVISSALQQGLISDMEALSLRQEFIV